MVYFLLHVYLLFLCALNDVVHFFYIFYLHLILIRNENEYFILEKIGILQVSTFEEFILRLGITDSVTKVKVVSIFGNTGDGKSYTLNNAFFDKQEVFKTSSSQSSCTLGVWIAYDPKLQILCLDTEGLLSSSNLELHTTRLLLKVQN